MKFKVGDRVRVNSVEFPNWNDIKSVIVAVNPGRGYPYDMAIPERPKETICMLEDELYLDKEYSIRKLLLKIDGNQ